jgi:acyl-coenzyme A synthetase/AMP-(fatty) acid ligase
VPYHYEMLARLDLDRLDVPSLAVCTQAGGCLKSWLVDRFARTMTDRGGRFYVMYGQTEAAPRMTTLPAERVLDKPSSVGPVLPGGRLEIRDQEDRPVQEPGVAGEVVYFGPNVMLGYAVSRECLTLADQQEGMLRTGDMGYLDEEGYLYITGRLARFAKVQGRRFGLEDVEQLAGTDARVAAIESRGGIVVFGEGLDDSTCANLRRRLLSILKIHPSSLTVRTLETLPLKANGKVDYKMLDRWQ